MATTDTQHPTEPATDGGGPQMKEGEEDVGKLEGTTKSGDTPTEEVSNSSNSQPNNTTGTVPDQPVGGGGKEGEAEGSGGEEETEEPLTETLSTTGTTPTPPVTVPTNPSEPSMCVPVNLYIYIYVHVCMHVHIIAPHVRVREAGLSNCSVCQSVQYFQTKRSNIRLSEFSYFITDM